MAREGEWALVDWVRKEGAASLPDSIVGPGDDAAVLPWTDGDLVVTTDMVAEGTHFHSDADPLQVGRFAAAVNLSDLAAMGARPVGLVAACGAPRTTGDDWFQGVARGLLDLLGEYGCPLVGGDMKTAPARVVAGTAMGRVPRGEALLRSGAQAGDFVVGSGSFGGPGAALALLDQGGRSRSEAMQVVHGVRPRLELGSLLRESGAHAAVDTSDGLARAVTLLAQASGLAVDVDLEAVPVDPWVEEAAGSDRGAPGWVETAMGTGGEYELVAAVPPKRWPLIQEAARESGVPLTRIGGFRTGQGVVGAVGDRKVELQGSGWRQR